MKDVIMVCPEGTKEVRYCRKTKNMVKSLVKKFELKREKAIAKNVSKQIKGIKKSRGKDIKKASKDLEKAMAKATAKQIKGIKKRRNTPFVPGTKRELEPEFEFGGKRGKKSKQ